MGVKQGASLEQAGRASVPGDSLQHDSPCRDLHEFRHSVLIHLGEALMANCQHKAENVRRYVKPSHEAIDEVTSLLAAQIRRSLDSPPETQFGAISRSTTSRKLCGGRPVRRWTVPVVRSSVPAAMARSMPASIAANSSGTCVVRRSRICS